jgi:hypothetical protein
MNNLLKGIEIAINNAIEEYSGLIVKKYNLDPKELEEIWNSVCKNNKITINTNVKKSPEIKTDLKNVPNDGACPYVFSKGKNSGEVCNGKPKNGCQYCSKHTKFEGVGQTEKKVTPSKKSISKTTSTKKKSPEPKSTDIIIRKNQEINKFWDPKTELVFRSQDDRVVIASYRDDKLNKLVNDDILLCEQYGFKYDKNEVEEDLTELVNNLKNNKTDVDSVIDSDDSDDEIDEKPLKKTVSKKTVEKKEAPKITKTVEKKEIPKITKTIEKKEAPKITKAVEKKDINKSVISKISSDKKSIKDIISTVNDKAHDVENLLKEIQNGDDDEFEEQEELDDDDDDNDDNDEELEEEY